MKFSVFMVLSKLKAAISSKTPKEIHKRYKIQKSEFKIEFVLLYQKKKNPSEQIAALLQR
jgi:hypothetical protein